MNYKKNYFPLLFFLLLSFVTKSQDIDAIRTAARTAFLIGIADDPNLDEDHYQAILTDLNSTGKFTSLMPYPSHNFDETHLQYLVELTQARARLQDDPGLFQNITLANLETEILNGLNWWYQNVDYYDHAGNGGSGHPDVGWWWNEIGKQRELQKISVLFYDYLIANDPLLTNPIDVPLWYTVANNQAPPCPSLKYATSKMPSVPISYSPCKSRICQQIIILEPIK
jgi:hypothetical protein